MFFYYYNLVRNSSKLIFYQNPLSLCRNRVVSNNERRERERVTVDDDVNSALSPLCTTMSVQCTQALANNNGKTPLRSKHFTWTVVPIPPPSLK